MTSARDFIRKHRKELTLAYTILYVSGYVIVWMEKEPEFSIGQWFKIVLFYFYGIMFIWYVEKPDEMVEYLYFNKYHKNEIIEAIKQSGFKLIRESNNKVLFAQGKYWIFWDRISIYKSEGPVIYLKGRAKFLNHLYKYRIQYKSL